MDMGTWGLLALMETYSHPPRGLHWEESAADGNIEERQGFRSFGGWEFVQTVIAKMTEHLRKEMYKTPRPHI